MARRDVPTVPMRAAAAELTTVNQQHRCPSGCEIMGATRSDNSSPNHHNWTTRCCSCRSSIRWKRGRKRHDDFLKETGKALISATSILEHISKNPAHLRTPEPHRFVGNLSLCESKTGSSEKKGLPDFSEQAARPSTQADICMCKESESAVITRIKQQQRLKLTPHLTNFTQVSQARQHS